MLEESLIISGFGRSGTTWLSDILSKTLGGLILFEPFHPCIFSNSHEYCYNSNVQNTSELKEHLRKCFSEAPENYWLLRNHLPSDPNLISKSYVDYIWNNSNVIGIKTLRLNHSLKKLSLLTKSKVVYIVRNPFAVLCSINNRPNFWKEFGWSWHKAHFIKKALSGPYFDDETKSELSSLANDIESDEEFIVLMWSISFLISLNEIFLCNGHLVCYENLYLNPYSETLKILKYLGRDKVRSLHPSYFFTPSMTSLSTIHHASEMENISKSHLDEVFWKCKLELRSIENLEKVIIKSLSVDNRAMQRALEFGYLS